jgi:regulator of sigma E protease
MNSAADLAKLKAGDIITKLNGTPMYSFEDLRKTLQEIKVEEVELVYLRNGEKIKVKIKPQFSSEDGSKRKVIGVYTAGVLYPMKFVDLPSPGFLNSIPLAFNRTVEGTIKTIQGFKKLFFGEVGLGNIGGPLAIGKVASDSYNASITLFLQLMAFISINLGIINLLPIPILDGGHIMFIIIEILNRGPVSRKKMELAQQVGLSILLMLMVGAIFNDFSRFF